MAFDLRTHLRDPKSGRISSAQPYDLKIEGNQKRYVRKGVTYAEDGTVLSSALPTEALQVTESIDFEEAEAALAAEGEKDGLQANKNKRR